ncbi:excalibur calcium-binding domain-containing protein [Methyloversatilis universalis]|uniref:excalibur calcium-binding domain-containing protein n=1 Tax=Methyloversatilis universalis TaxID=378211 RepID=UPI00039E5795|nr:excalibur calcium-binding domain-containing protein [Methyloversatilis universalis]
MLAACASVAAHGGGLNAEGCHHNRKTGDYHCHRAAPVRAGEPGYGPHLDRDGDGIGCEPWRGR